METTFAVLKARDVAVGYPSKVVVRDVSLAVERGTCTVIVGGNGSGKSTLVRVLAGLARPLTGTVEIDGRDVRSYPPRLLARHVAHLPQSPLVPDGITVEELVLLGRHPHRGLLGGVEVADGEAVTWAMASTGVTALRERLVSELSGGERQRVWVAVALAQEAPALLLDEPTTFLDVRHQLELLELLRGLAADHGLAVLAVLHDLNHAAAFADRLVVLGAGRVLADGAPADVLEPALVRTAFGVDAEVEHVDGVVTCRFRTLDTTRSQPSPPGPPQQGDQPHAKTAHPARPAARPAGGGVWRRLRRRGRRPSLGVEGG